MLEHNRNLSSIVGKIQDEGPPAGISTGSTARVQDMNKTAVSVEAETLDSAPAGKRRSTRRSFFYLLFAALVLASTFIFVMGGRGGYLADYLYETGQHLPGLYMRVENAVSNLAGSAGPAGADESVVPAIVGKQDGSFSNHEIHERQALIMKHLEELAAAITDIKTDNDQYRVDTQSDLKGMQEDFQHKLDNIAATVAGLQEGSGDQEESSIPLVNGSSGVKVTQPDSDGVPAMSGWVVNVANSEHIKPIEKLMNKLHDRGIAAETQEVMIGGKTRYRLRIPGFSTSDEARDYAHDLDGDLGIKGPWVSRR